MHGLASRATRPGSRNAPDAGSSSRVVDLDEDGALVFTASLSHATVRSGGRRRACSSAARREIRCVAAEGGDRIPGMQRGRLLGRDRPHERPTLRRCDGRASKQLRPAGILALRTDSHFVRRTAATGSTAPLVARGAGAGRTRGWEFGLLQSVLGLAFMDRHATHRWRAAVVIDVSLFDPRARDSQSIRPLDLSGRRRVLAPRASRAIRSRRRHVRVSRDLHSPPFATCGLDPTDDGSVRPTSHDFDFGTTRTRGRASSRSLPAGRSAARRGAETPCRIPTGDACSSRVRRLAARRGRLLIAVRRGGTGRARSERRGIYDGSSPTNRSLPVVARSSHRAIAYASSVVVMPTDACRRARRVCRAMLDRRLFGDPMATLLFATAARSPTRLRARRLGARGVRVSPRRRS